MVKRPINPQAKAMGGSLRQFRDELGLTQLQVAERLGMTEQGYAAYEQGRARLITTDLPDIARSLGVSRDMLALRLGIISKDLAGQPQPMKVGAYRFLQVVEGVTVSAGMLGWIPTEASVMVEEDFARGRDLVPVRVSGDCLSPRIEHGDVVIMDRSDRRPNPGDVVVVITEQAELMIKEFDRDELGPLLRDYQGNVIRPNGAKIDGVVVLLQRRLR